MARYPVAGKSVLITGAARGIGAESARGLARKGAKVALVGLEPEELERVAADCGPEAIWFEVDVRDPDALERAVAGTVERFGGIDVAMANAGIGAGGLIARSAPEGIELVLEINLIGAVRTLRLCLPHVLERRGYVLAVASVAAIAQAPGMAAYSASKAGLEAFANALRMETRHHGVDVGVAYFSWIDTDMVRGADERGEFKTLRSQLTGPLSTTYPVSDAANSVVRGIERRARWVTVPNWLRVPLLLRSLVQFGAEREMRAKMEEFDRLSAEEAARLGEDLAAAPVGPGGEAAMRSAGRTTTVGP